MLLNDTSNILLGNVMDDGNILIVDDDRFLSLALKRQLEDNGYSVFTATNGQEALEIIDDYGMEFFSLLIIDVRMPILNGIELVKILKNRHGEVPAIIVSASDEEKYINEARELGVLNYLHKPINYKTLMKNVKDGFSGKCHSY